MGIEELKSYWDSLITCIEKAIMNVAFSRIEQRDEYSLLLR